MIPVAVVLIVLVIVFTIAIIIGNPQSFDLLVFVARIPANITGVYVTGAVTMLVLAVAGWLLWTGLVRLRAQQKEIRELKVAAGARTKSLSSGAGGSKSGKDTSAAPAAGKKGDPDAKDGAARSKAAASEKGGSAETGGGARATKPAPAGSAADEERRAGSAGSARESDASGRSARGSGSHDNDEASPSTRSDHGGRRTRAGDPSDDQPSTSPEERRRLLDEADELTRDDDGR